MNWGAEIFYGVCTVVAFGLSWKRGGSIAIAASLISAMWLFQGVIYWSGMTIAGNMMGSMISATLLILIATLPWSRALGIIMACLVTQLAMHVSLRMHGMYADPFYLAVNVLYLAQLIALGWSGGKRVLDELGDWVADLRVRWCVVGIARIQEVYSYVRLLFRSASRYYLGRNYVWSDRDLRRIGR